MAISEDILAQLRKRRFKITPQRRSIVEDILTCGKASTAQEVLERVGRHSPDISMDTVYRTLNLLTEMGILYRMEQVGKESGAYELETGGDHHHHLICTDCGKRECMDFCCLDDASQKARQHGFEITAHKLEFYGRCGQCAVKV